MKPAPFEYLAPATLEEALASLAEHGYEAKVLAGGQSLIPVMNFRLAQPAVLIDLNRLPGMDSISARPDGGLAFGALARHRQVERSALVAERAPLLHEAIPFVAHPQIRNRGTFGGSLAHADPAAELPAVALALDARVRLRRRSDASTPGDRWVEARDFFTGLFSTALEPEEILTEIEIPPPPPRTGFCFQEVARRLGDYAQVGLAARVTLGEDGLCRDARLVFLSVGPGPLEAREAARLLLGTDLSPAACEAAAEKAASDEIVPRGDVHATPEFKRHLARVLTRRCLRIAAERARSAGGPL